MVFFECPPQIYRCMVKLCHICAYLQICYKTKLLQKEERNFIQRNKTKMSTINKKQKIWNKNAQNAHKSRQILNSRPTEKCMLRQKIFVYFENFRGALLSRSTASATLPKCPPHILDYVMNGQPKAVNQERRSGWLWLDPHHLVFGICSNKYWS